jgi:FkbM family methyltransferase
MKVYDCKMGRLGNAIFRYFASTLFCIINNCERTYHQDECKIMLNDDSFIDWSKKLLNNEPYNFDDNVYMFYGFYQHDEIFIKYKKEIINWIITHPNELLYTDGNNNTIKYFNYDETSYKALQLIINPYSPKNYNVVVHLRLEDFIFNKEVLHPDVIINILKEINEKDICIVVNKLKTIVEQKYIDYFKNDFNVTVESNSIIEDFHIMKNAKILVCSCSTISWAAALLSDKVKLVYMPDYPNRRNHETFKKPIDNTILYEYRLCTDLNDFFKISNVEKEEPKHKTLNEIKLDPYCAINCKKEPITKRIIEYIGNIENGFYIEAGAYDGVTQSNTKFLEEEYNWTGILIDPNPIIQDKLNKNRPNNIIINKCLVGKQYNNETIKFALDNGPMASVNNIRNIENAELIDVPCDKLENILDYLDVIKIDFMSIDTEGYELEVLDGLNLKKYRPTYILIEIYQHQLTNITSFMNDNNYILLENITNYNNYDNPGWDGTHNDYLFKAM